MICVRVVVRSNMQSSVDQQNKTDAEKARAKPKYVCYSFLHYNCVRCRLKNVGGGNKLPFYDKQLETFDKNDVGACNINFCS